MFVKLERCFLPKKFKFAKANAQNVASHILFKSSGGSRVGGGGGSRRPPPLIFDRLRIFSPFCIRMLRNKAQIARESNKPHRASRVHKPPPPPPPGRKGLRARDVRAAHNLLRPPPPPQQKSWICP